MFQLAPMLPVFDVRCVHRPNSTLKDITKFEKQNPSISVDVFGYEGGDYPLRISEQPEGTNHVDLFLIANEKGMQHYC